MSLSSLARRDRVAFLPSLALACLAATQLGCSLESRAGGAKPAAESSAAIDTFVAQLRTVGKIDDAPEPEVDLPAGPALGAGNTLVIAEEDLATLRGTPAAHAAGTPPKRDERVAIALKPTGDRGSAETQASMAAQLGQVAYLAVPRERASIALPAESRLARDTVAVWDLAGKRWLGSLWVTVELTKAKRQEMVTVNGHGKQVGPSFIETESAEAIAARHQATLGEAIDTALRTRHTVWKQWDMGVPPFDPSREKAYSVAVPADRPSRGAEGARVVVQLFGQLGDSSTSLLVARIVQTYGNRVRLVWRNRTLDFAKGSDAGAQAALEVFAQGGERAFWPFFEATAALPHPAWSSPKLDTDTLVNVAKGTGGVDPIKLRTAIDAHAHAASIKADMAALKGAGLGQRTSTILVNGWLVESSAWAAVAARIEAALGR